LAFITKRKKTVAFPLFFYVFLIFCFQLVSFIFLLPGSCFDLDIQSGYLKARNNNVLEDQTRCAPGRIDPRVIGNFDKTVPEFEVISSNVHLSNGLYWLAILKKLAENSNRGIASGRVGVSADESGYKDASPKVLHYFFH